MSAPEIMTEETKARQSATALIGSLIAVLSLVVIGYPLAPAAIRTMLFGWILIVVAVTKQYTSEQRFQKTTLTTKR